MTGEMTTLTVQEVTRRVEEIRNIADDPEKAHSLEDILHQDVLAAIANGACDDPAACARAALATKEIDFGRWYA